MKLIIFAEFSAKGVPPPPPSRKIIIFFLKFFFIGLKWFTCCEMDSVWYGKFIWAFLIPSLWWEHVVVVSIQVGCLNIFWAFEKIIYFHGWGVPPSPPFEENSAKFFWALPLEFSKMTFTIYFIFTFLTRIIFRPLLFI